MKTRGELFRSIASWLHRSLIWKEKKNITKLYITWKMILKQSLKVKLATGSPISKSWHWHFRLTNVIFHFRWPGLMTRLVEDNFLQYIYNFAVRSTTFSFIYLTSNKICTTCLSNKPLIDLFTQLLTCRHQGCFAIYDVLFTCLTYGSFYNSPTKYTT